MDLEQEIVLLKLKNDELTAALSAVLTALRGLLIASPAVAQEIRSADFAGRYLYASGTDAQLRVVEMVLRELTEQRPN